MKGLVVFAVKVEADPLQIGSFPTEISRGV